MLLISLYLLWLVLNARITWEILLMGIPVAGLVWFLSLKLFSAAPAEDFRRLRRLPSLLAYLFFLLREVIVSALRILRLIWSPGRPDSAIAEFTPALKTDSARMLLAASITLTPGTITLETEEGHFSVHCLEASSAESLPESAMLRKIQKLEDRPS